jgi:hypothetical protein
MLQMVGIQLLFSQQTPDSRMSDTHLHWYPLCADSRSFIQNIQNILFYFRSRRSWLSSVGNMRCKIPMFTKAAMDTYNPIWTFSSWIPFFGTNDEPPQHCHPPNHTWNAYRLALDLSTLSQQLEITTQHTVTVHFSYKDLETFQDCVGLF